MLQKKDTGLKWAAIAGCRGSIARGAFVAISLTRAKNQCDQVLRRLRLACRLQQWSAVHVLSAELQKNPANPAVALAVVLGSTTVEMPATHSLITHGPRASRLAKVVY